MEEIESNSYSEVLRIIELLPDDYQKKIPEKQMNILWEKSNKEYFSKMRKINQIDEVPLTEKAYAIIIALWINYIATDIQKEKVRNFYESNNKIAIKSIYENHNDIILKQNNSNKSNNISSSEILPVEIKKKENIFYRILKKLFGGLSNKKI